MKSIAVNDELHKEIKKKSNMIGQNISSLSERLLTIGLQHYKTEDNSEKESNIIKPPFKRGGLLEKLYFAFGGEIPTKQIRNSRDPNAEYIFTKTQCILYSSSFELTPENEVIQLKHCKGTTNNSRSKYPRSIYDIMYVKHVLENGVFRVKDMRDLLSTFKYKSYTLSFILFVYNVREGTFDNVLEEFVGKVMKATLKTGVVDNHEMIFINDEASSVSYNLGKEIHMLMSNCIDPYECVYNLVHMYPDVNCGDIVLVACNYTQLYFEYGVYEVPVENNPSKRRNNLRISNGLMGANRV